MKKIVCFGLCFMIILSSFVLVCAAGASPVIVPQGTSGGFGVQLQNGNTRYFSSNISPVYIVYYHTPSGGSHIVAFSDSSGTILYGTYDGVTSEYALTSVYNGYYYRSGITSAYYPEERYYIDGIYSSAEEVIDYIESTVFDVTFNLSYLVDGSVLWLGSMASAALEHPLLLFLLLAGFIGLAIGLLNRFRR